MITYKEVSKTKPTSIIQITLTSHFMVSKICSQKESQLIQNCLLLQLIIVYDIEV